MTLFECINAFLATSGTLAAKVTGGFAPGYLSQDAVFPVGTVRYISGASQPATHDVGPSPWSLVRFEITVWGADYLSMEQAAAIIGKLFQVSAPVYLGGSPNGLFSPQQIQGPRDVREEVRRATGIQIDIIGLLNGDTIS